MGNKMSKGDYIIRVIFHWLMLILTIFGIIFSIHIVNSDNYVTLHTPEALLIIALYNIMLIINLIISTHRYTKNIREWKQNNKK